MASIVPSRTGPLGQKRTCEIGEINGTCVNLSASPNDFTESNYDHSAQWLHAYHKRSSYWKSVCFTFFGEQSTCLDR